MLKPYPLAILAKNLPESAKIQPFHCIISAMFLTGQFFLFRTLVAVYDPVLELHACVWSVREVRALGRGWQRMFKINNFDPSKTWCIYTANEPLH